MRRISIAVATAAVAFTLAACGGDDAGGVGAPNGLEAKSGEEVLRTAAAALRNAGSVRVVTEGTSNSAGATAIDLRLDGDNTAGTITGSGVTFDIVRVDGATYLRSSNPSAAPLPTGAEADQWTAAGGGDAEDFQDLTLDGLADSLEKQADVANAAVEKTVEDGRAVVVVTTTENDRYLISNTGPGLPVVETHADDGTITVRYSQYGEEFDIQAPSNVTTPAS